MICVKRINLVHGRICVSGFCPCIYHIHRIMHALWRCLRACVRMFVHSDAPYLPTYICTCIASPTEHRECGDYATRVARCNRPTVLYQRSLACRFYLTRFETPLDLNENARARSFLRDATLAPQIYSSPKFFVINPRKRISIVIQIDITETRARQSKVKVPFEYKNAVNCISSHLKGRNFALT